jgi:hypothetical protein
MASLTESLPKWKILGRIEPTQSNTYMPLIYSVSDDFTIQFPPGYEATFNRSIQTANTLMKLPFADFKEFQERLKRSLIGVIGTAEMQLQNPRYFDHPYHLKGRVQEQIINGVMPDGAMDVFMGILIPNLSRLTGQDCILHNRPKQELRKWHWMGDDGYGIPFSDKESDQIQQSTRPITITPIGSKDSYTIDKKTGTQTNNRTKQQRNIAFMGGRRTKRKRTRRTQNRRIQKRFATFKQSSTKKSSSI